MTNVVHPGKLRLGKHPPKIDKRTLKIERYVDFAKLPPPPEQRLWSTLCGPSIGMMANDTVGDCTVATFGHAIQVWTANTGKEVTVSDQTILNAYSAVSGYNPLHPDDTDNGAVLLDVLKYMRNVGLSGHKIGAFVALQPGNRQHVEIAINLFGGIALGLALPKSAQAQVGKVWKVPLIGARGCGAPGSWGGHATFNPDFAKDGPVCATWGLWQRMTWPFFVRYCDEAFAILSPDWVQPGKAAPSGFDLATLQADLKLVTL